MPHDFNDAVTEQVIDGIKTIYKKTVLPLEADFKFNSYYDSPLTNADFDSKPIVLLMGQFSVGKTTFIKHLIGRDFKGMHIGPEPTTDKFCTVYHSKEDAVIPGPMVTLNPDLPFSGLNQFGQDFLNKFTGCPCSSGVLKSMTFVDTPGILSGKKQRKRQYDYEEVAEWFANKADRILLFFDCSKLDISDEFKSMIFRLRNFDDKLRIVLNKADSLKERELMRVYGGLMWNLGKVFKTPEILRVYISSFSADKPLNKDNYCYPLFKEDGAALLADLKSLPRDSAMRSLQKLQKRMNLVKLHVTIILELKSEMPSWFGKKAKQKKILEGIGKRFKKIAKKTRVAPADFPALDKFKNVLEEEDLSAYPKESSIKKKLQKLDYAIKKTLPSLIRKINRDKTRDTDNSLNVDEIVNPFIPEDEFDTKSRNSRGKARGRGKSNVRKIARSGLASRRLKVNSVKKKGSRNAVSEDTSQNQDELTASVRLRKRSAVPSFTASGKDDGLRSMLTDVPDTPAAMTPRMRTLPRKNSNSPSQWVVTMIDKTESDNIFYRYAPRGNLTGSNAKKAFARLGVPTKVAGEIWVLVDFNQNNELDADQFALAYWLSKEVRRGKKVPQELTWEMLPPAYREM